MKKLITQTDLKKSMDQHQDESKKVVGNGHKYVYTCLKMQIWLA